MPDPNGSSSLAPLVDEPAVRALATRLSYLPAEEGARALAASADEEAAAAIAILWQVDGPRRERLIAAAPGGRGEQWRIDREYPEGTIGRWMERPLAVFPLGTTVGEAVETLREMVKRAHIVYGFVTDEAGILRGVFAFRELLFAAPEDTLESLMVHDPLALRPEMTVLEAVRAAVALHVPAYPVCDAAGRLVGMVRGRSLFEAEAFEISAQAGSLVGVDKEERLATRWARSFKMRHPWLQLNLLTAFVAGAVVALFQGTIDRIAILAMFLPVLAGQSGNTGCQALAVTLRGLTLGDFAGSSPRRLVAKEALLGLLNGALVGLVAGGGMVFVATSQGHPSAWPLGLAVMLAMVGSCVASGVCGAMIPLALKRLGADPATASSIFLTTATDVVSMGLLLGLATALVR